MIFKKNTMKILDGGFGTNLRDKYGNVDVKVWSLRPLVDGKIDTFRNCHIDFINAGCDVITTGNYCATPYYIDKLDNTVLDVKDYITLSGVIANELKSTHNIEVAGCIPPYGESYSTNVSYSDQALYDHYNTTARCLYDYVDFYLAETITSKREAELIFLATKQYNKPLYLSFCVQDNGINLLDGTSIFPFLDLDVKGIMLNCCPVSHVLKGIPKIVQRLPKDMEFGVYPNLHEHIPEHFVLDEGKKPVYQDMTPKEFTEKLTVHSLDYVGGCCGIGPEYISELRNGLKIDD